MRKSNKFISLLLAGTMTAVLAGCGNSSTAAETTVAETTAAEESTSALPEAYANSAALVIAEQGMFSSGGTVTEPVEGEFDETANWLDMTRAGNTAHVDHANVLYQIPENESGMPMVFLHGYGQSRMGWMSTPDGRDGWATSFLK